MQKLPAMMVLSLSIRISMTSHDVVSCMRKLCNTRKIGHGGTLDPMATGGFNCCSWSCN